MKKKIFMGMLIICMIFAFMMGKIYAVGTYEIKVETDKASVKPGDTVTVTISLTNIEIEPGIGAVTGKLEYDKTVFEKITNTSIKSGNGWGSVVYNDQNESEGFFVVERALADIIKTDSAVFKVTFKVLSSPKLGDTDIKLTKISCSNGEADIEIPDVTGRIKIAKVASSTDDNNTTNNNMANNDGTNNSGTDNKNINSNGDVADRELPAAGMNNYILPTTFVILAIGAISYVQYRKMKNI